MKTLNIITAILSGIGCVACSFPIGTAAACVEAGFISPWKAALMAAVFISMALVLLLICRKSIAEVVKGVRRG